MKICIIKFIIIFYLIIKKNYNIITILFIQKYLNFNIKKKKIINLNIYNFYKLYNQYIIQHDFLSFLFMFTSS